ncbi:MAG: DNA methyltransferase [Bacilli bacterium]
MKIKTVEIDKCRPWDKNPRGIKKDDFERLKRQIKRLGVYKPLIATQENDEYVILGGNMRLLALRELGYQKVDISIVDAPTEKEKIEYSLSDNDRVGYYEEEKLAELIQPHLKELELSDFKVDLGEAINLENLYEKFGPDLSDKEEDELPAIDDKPATTKPGDLYLLGKHKLLCGDSFDKANLSRLIGNSKIGLLLADPPYGISIVGKDGKIGGGGICNNNIFKPVIGDDKPFNPIFFLDISLITILWGANNYASKLPDKSGWIVWDKGAAHKSTFSECELAWTNVGKAIKKYEYLWAGLSRQGSRKDEGVKRMHPTQKPVGLFAQIIKEYTKPGDIILDPFLGSGTTIIAAEKTGHPCFGIEIDPQYCDLIITRYANYVGIDEEQIRTTKQEANDNG